ncbi:hypothetical protein, conserved [Eimeria necatrix]|uniref:Uncharacterized protein n=1 Tax=Eimeria necatrix TaxID=51315 RepID=U6MJB0_9EIME|nr:hypothetical protein, conserved [Eimeria necatrix]CDJ64332.1 hypothetical protein, conserved [Eimeria necatrix]
MTGELDPRFLRSFRATWEDTPSSHAVPQAALTALGLTRGDFLDVKAWIFLVARKLQFVNGERAAFKACEALAALFGDPRCFAIVQDALLAAVPKEDVPQVLASCCLKLTAQFESQSNEADHDDFLVGPTSPAPLSASCTDSARPTQKMMNLEHTCAPQMLAWLETAVFACLSSTDGFSFSVRPPLLPFRTSDLMCSAFTESHRSGCTGLPSYCRFRIFDQAALQCS